MESKNIFMCHDAEVVRDVLNLYNTDGLYAGMITCKKYFFHHMLNVRVSSRGRCESRFVSFVDVFNNIDRLMQVYPYLEKAVTYSVTRYPDKPMEYHVFDMFRLYFASVAIFKPSIAKQIVQTYKPSIVLDPCCGWGSRMLGSVAGGCDLFVGLDSNSELIADYNKMIVDLDFVDKCKIHNVDCLEFDYSGVPYDMLLTSPPYYNTEVYCCSEVKTKDEWDCWYNKAFRLWWDGLRVGGIMAIAIPFEVYDIAERICGSADDSVRLRSTKRTGDKQETELIFIWIKN